MSIGRPFAIDNNSVITLLQGPKCSSSTLLGTSLPTLLLSLSHHHRLYFFNLRARLSFPRGKEMTTSSINYFCRKKITSLGCLYVGALGLKSLVFLRTSLQAVLENPSILGVSSFRYLSHPLPIRRRKLSSVSAMDSSNSESDHTKEFPLGLDQSTEEEYATQSKLLREFTTVASIDKAWTFPSGKGTGSQAMFYVGQANLLANKRRKYMLSSNISKEDGNGVKFQWAPFPVEMTGVSTIIPSPSGSKVLVVRNADNDSPSQLEIWDSSQLEKEFHIPKAVHGSIYTDGWFEGISWNYDESLIAYVAEEPLPCKPTFGGLGYKKGNSSTDKECGDWKGQGDWQEEWGESYAGKRQSALFVISVNSGKVQAIKGVDRSISVGQVVWAPPLGAQDSYLVFVGWLADPRKLGMIYCYNRPCALYAVKAPLYKLETDDFDLNSVHDSTVLKLTQSISSAFFPRFSPDGKFLVFLSARRSVDSGAHSATNSLHKLSWPANGKLCASAEITDVISVVYCADDGEFPGLYCSGVLSKPWLSDGCTMILPSIWRSSQVLLAVNVLSGKMSRISPESKNSWNILSLDGNNVIAVCSSPIDVPQIKYGTLSDETSTTWNWFDVSSPISRCSVKVSSLLASLQFDVLKVPVKNVSDCSTKGATKPFDTIFVSSKQNGESQPLIVILHGGPHGVSLSSFSKTSAFLSSIGFSLLIVNYRGSIGFGEEALQSLPGKIGFQDVNDVLTSIDYVIDNGFSRPSKIMVLGGSHGGFLTAHLIGQAPEKFAAAVARNPVCNLASMVGVTDIPDWCYVEAYGTEGKKMFTEAPTAEHLADLYRKSPISHISKVKTPTLMLLGAQDLRVPVSNGLQYARALKEKGVDTKLIIFPNDIHPIDKPQSEFESFLNIGVWFKKYSN